ncbi:PepSY domain-containing protein [Hyphomicrobium denitrificans]|uniref:PepSY domain-containing protein n=1 Tax=Hyphomicrobium denitrificans TaxID=53399 RepID=UPI00022E31CD|nr:PepSY domain-containing protein [Hyphomicrobium denitrificans]
MHKALTLSTLAALLFVTGSALADDHHKNRLNIPVEKWLSTSDVTQKLTAQGYNVTKIEADDGVYEFDALDANGVRIEGHANPATGEVLTGYDD